MTILANIPDELKQLRQWVCSDTHKMPMNPRTNKKASVTDPDTWVTFDEAASAGFPYLGLVFTKNDPYTFIDLDTGKRPDFAQLHYQIITEAGGYAEVSISGKSYHVIVKGSLPSGMRDDLRGIEVYPHDRFMLITGNTIPPSCSPINDNQGLLDFLTMKITTSREVKPLQSEPATVQDQALLDNMAAAVNGDKFHALFYGGWERYSEYMNDHSRADLGLLTMLDFYSKDVDQVVRLFKRSALYRPSKGRSNTDGTDYIMRTLKKARSLNGNEVPEAAVTEGLKNATARMLETFKKKKSSSLTCQLMSFHRPLGWSGLLQNTFITAQSGQCVKQHC